MKINVKNINDYTKEVELDVPWTTIEPDFESTIKKFSKKVKLPGFRPGKIPRDRLMQQFQPNIEAQFMDDNIHKYYLLALQERKIVPVNQAEIRDVQFQLGEHFSFTAKFEVEPDFKLPKFKNNMFKVQKNKFIPDEQDITDGINQLRRSHARIETVEDGAQEKDFILCDLQKLDESGVAIIGKKFEKQMLKVGDGSFTDDQTSKLIGLKPGESSKLDLPDNEDKTIKNPYELTVVKVEREVLPDNAKSGLIIFDKTKPICAGFIYLTNSKVALIEWVISDKKYNDKRKKVKALNLLIDALILTCSILKIKYIKADNESKSLTKAFIKKGFEKGDIVTHLIKKI